MSTCTIAQRESDGDEDEYGALDVPSACMFKRRDDINLPVGGETVQVNRGYKSREYNHQNVVQAEKPASRLG